MYFIILCVCVLKPLYAIFDIISIIFLFKFKYNS